ncbi:bifunctional 3,4-dihydroxy-2-butanone-4-phosphate synthase/GTP cyclohydrolase II [Saccharopolyspora rosea]|uniref:3,4-dihydroxy-2-butanone-4-phosphate synthase n=1 Tax=Saccharopolyspora rosea TaxID=524884 RepID=A0ABW3G445_9PSEU
MTVTAAPRSGSVEQAGADLARGRPVVLAGGDAGHLVLAARTATPEAVAFLVRHTSGVLRAAMSAADLERLDLPPVVARGHTSAVPVDAAVGTTDGVRAADRARTLRVLADPGSGPEQLTAPGHVFPVRAREGGVLAHLGPVEAALDLVRSAGEPPVAALAEIVGDDGDLVPAGELVLFAARHDLALVSVDEVVRYRRHAEPQVERAAEARLPLREGEFRAIGYREVRGGAEHLALVHGELGDGEDVLVVIHPECPAGALPASLGCGCGAHLRSGLAAVVEEGRGVLVYLRGQPRCGALHDTAAAPPDDVRVAQVLRDLGVRSPRLRRGSSATT